MPAIINDKIAQLNKRDYAVIFVVTGLNGSGKTIVARRLLVDLNFHQTFNLGSVTKTLRYLSTEETTNLENFKNSDLNKLYTPIVQFACKEYQCNGVNVIIDGVQIDTSSTGWQESITGGIILEVPNSIKTFRNNKPDTHFKRVLYKTSEDNFAYAPNDTFRFIDNSNDIDDTYNKVLRVLDGILSRKLRNLGEDS
jgi:tRNA uridine 5-carbamoylmethylation protein Kti12